MHADSWPQLQGACLGSHKGQLVIACAAANSAAANSSSQATLASTCLAAGLAGLCAARDAREGQVLGVQLIDISLRGLHVKRQNALSRPLVAALQKVLRETQLGQAFFGNVARPQVRRGQPWRAGGRVLQAGQARMG